jgi:hypothetical protein
LRPSITNVVADGPRDVKDCEEDLITVVNDGDVDASAYASPRTSPELRSAATVMLLMVADVDVMVALGREPTVVNWLVDPVVVPSLLVAIPRM